MRIMVVLTRMEFEMASGKLLSETQLRPFFRRTPPEYINRNGHHYKLVGYNPANDDSLLGLLYFVDVEYRKIG